MAVCTTHGSQGYESFSCGAARDTVRAKAIYDASTAEQPSPRRRAPAAGALGRDTGPGHCSARVDAHVTTAGS